MNDMEQRLYQMYPREVKHFEARWYEEGEHHKREFTDDMRFNDNPYEWQNAVAEKASDLSKMSVGDVIFFDGNRDGHDKTGGYIVRVK